MVWSGHRDIHPLTSQTLFNTQDLTVWYRISLLKVLVPELVHIRSWESILESFVRAMIWGEFWRSTGSFADQGSRCVPWAKPWMSWAIDNSPMNGTHTPSERVAAKTPSNLRCHSWHVREEKAIWGVTPMATTCCTGGIGPWAVGATWPTDNKSPQHYGPCATCSRE